MKIIKFNDSEIFKPASSCEVREYLFNDVDINIGTAIINGRFPESGFLLNETVKEYAYAISGSGNIVTKDNTYSFSQGDVIFIPAKEPYYWDATCQLIMPCAPAWYPEQSKNID